MHPLNEQGQQIMRKLADNYILFQTCSDRLQHLGAAKINSLHNEAEKKWQSNPSNPLVELPRNDIEKRLLYFAKCDEICGIEPKTLEEYVISKHLSHHRLGANGIVYGSYFMIGFACWPLITWIAAKELRSKLKLWEVDIAIMSKDTTERTSEKNDLL